MKKAWTDEAWEDYLTLQNDKKLLKKANALLKDLNVADITESESQSH